MSQTSSREFFHYTEWEEHACGMWRRTYGDGRQELLSKAIEFTGNDLLYGEWMMRAIERWPISCSQNLSFAGQNRQAWIGHAACCLAINCPEDVTREAWWHLSDEQRRLANEAADRAILAWERKKKESRQLKLFVE